MGVRIVSFFVLAMAAVALGSCGEAPRLSLDDVEAVRFTAIFSGASRMASDTEVERFVGYYSEARSLADDFGTTPPARIDVTLKSGETLTIWGGGQHYQTVVRGDRQYNIENEGLHQMLQEIASRP